MQVIFLALTYPSSAHPYLYLEENHDFYHVGLLPQSRNKTEEIFQKFHLLRVLCMYHIWYIGH